MTNHLLSVKSFGHYTVLIFQKPSAAFYPVDYFSLLNIYTSQNKLGYGTVKKNQTPRHTVLKIIHVFPSFDTFIPGDLMSPLSRAFTWQRTLMEQPLFGKRATKCLSQEMPQLIAQASHGLTHPSLTTIIQSVNNIFLIYKYTSIWSLLSVFTANIQANIISFLNYGNVFITKRSS